MHKLRNITFITLISLMVSALSGCGYNTLVELDEKVNQAWAQVENQYQRRADLIPNLVNPETLHIPAELDHSLIPDLVFPA